MAVDYVARARRLDWRGLRALWQRIESGTADEWAPGRALEHLVLRAFELSGASVRWPYIVHLDGVPVEQIDGAVHAGALSCIVECKDAFESVSIEAIAKIRNQLLRRPASAVGLMFSRGGFSSPALTLARFAAPQTVLLWSGEEIADLLTREDFSMSLVEKYRASVEGGLVTEDRREEGIA
jgi:hypothetical protein